MIPFLAASVLASSLLTARLVDPFVGTSGTPIGGPVDTFPGADMPFGMVQWSPDTPSQNAGGGYEYGDRTITGFSLTHLSGPGCSVFGDFAMMPANGPVDSPAKAAAAFLHTGEMAVPGYYAVSVGEPAIRVQLAVTDRTGLGVFTFASPNGSIVINPASNQAGVTQASIRVIDTRTIEADASSGYFCGMPDRYTVYEIVRFDRPFAASQILDTGNNHFDWARLRFDTARDPVVRAQVALSFVDAAGARTNLAAEATSWNIVNVRNRALARVGIDALAHSGERRNARPAASVLHGALPRDAASKSDRRRRRPLPRPRR